MWKRKSGIMVSSTLRVKKEPLRIMALESDDEFWMLREKQLEAKVMVESRPRGMV